MRNKQFLIEVIVALLVLMFLHTAVSKLLDFNGFVYDLNNQPFPNSLTPFLSWMLPLSEIAIVLCLLFERTRILGLCASLVLMVIFTVYTALVLLGAFEYVPCSCGGVVSYLTWPQHLIFNLFFLLVNLIAIMLHTEKNSPYNLQT